MSELWWNGWWSAQDNKQITQEFRLNGEFTNSGTWVTGLFYMDREQVVFERPRWVSLEASFKF